MPELTPDHCEGLRGSSSIRPEMRVHRGRVVERRFFVRDTRSGSGRTLQQSDQSPMPERARQSVCRFMPACEIRLVFCLPESRTRDLCRSGTLLAEVRGNDGGEHLESVGGHKRRKESLLRRIARTMLLIFNPSRL
jgi:hypothetical protein